MIRQFRSIKLSSSSGRSRTVRTNENLGKIKNRLRLKGQVSARKLSVELNISESVRRILKVDLGLRPYKEIIVPAAPCNQTKTA